MEEHLKVLDVLSCHIQKFFLSQTTPASTGNPDANGGWDARNTKIAEITKRECSLHAPAILLGYPPEKGPEDSAVYIGAAAFRDVYQRIVL